MATVTELVTKFTFEGSLSPLSNFNDELGGSVALLSSMVAGVVAVAGVMNTFVVMTLAGSDSVGHLSKVTGVAVEDIQELGFVASVSGSSIEAMEGTIDSLSKTIGDAAQKGSEDFARLGISVRDQSGQVKKADRILFEIAQRFKDLKLSMQEQLGFASSLGIDASLIQLMNRSSKEMLTLRKRARDLGVVSQEQQDDIIDFNDSITVLRFGLSAIQKQIAIGLSPTIKEMSEDFTDLLVSNKDWIVEGLIKTGDGINALLDAIGRLKFILAGLVATFIILKVAALGFGTVMGVIFSPIVLITAGIAALLLLVDDLIVAFQGGKSVVRDFFQEFFGIDITPILQDWVAQFMDGIKMIGDALSFMYDLFLKPWIDGLGFIVNKIGGLFRLDKNTPQGVTPSGQAFNQPTSIDNSIRQENTFDIRGSNSQAIADDVGSVLDRQLADADNQLDRGGR